LAEKCSPFGQCFWHPFPTYESNSNDYLNSRILLAMIGKLFIFSSFNAIYIHAGEIFPTVLRHTGIGSCSISARIGTILAPFVKEIVSQVCIFGKELFI
jgi:OCT family organic cation transporter-like MFS transporter 4/5